MSKGAVVVPPPWFFTRPSISIVWPQSDADVEEINDEFTRSGKVELAIALLTPLHHLILVAAAV